MKKFEVWKKIHTDYYVSNLGKIRRNNTLLKLIKTKKGYLVVNLPFGGKIKQCFVHRLVAEAFIPNKKNKPVINHIDNNPLNNNIWNLEWVTVAENRAHTVKQGRQKGQGGGEKNTQAKLTRIKVDKIRLLYPKNIQKNIAKQFKVHQSLISLIVRKKIWL